jgi:hypothetical protein
LTIKRVSSIYRFFRQEIYVLRVLKQLLGFVVELWPLGIAGLLFLAAKSLEDAYLFPSVGQLVNYQFLSDSRQLIPSLTCIFLPFGIVVIFICVGRSFNRKSQSKTKSIVNAISLLFALGLLIYSNGLMCLQTFGLALSDFGHFQSTQFDGHVYYVDSIWKEGVGRDHRALFTMFECGMDGTWCKSIFEKRYFPEDDEYPKMTTSLVANSMAHTIALQINGETVYVHLVK